MRNPVVRLRFKAATSFAMAALGCIAFSRLVMIEPFNAATIAPFVVIAVVVLASIWRGVIYLQAVRGMV